MREQPMRHVTHQMTRFFLKHKDEMQIAAVACQPCAKRMIVPCCAVCAVFVGVLSTLGSSEKRSQWRRSWWIAVPVGEVGPSEERSQWGAVPVRESVQEKVEAFPVGGGPDGSQHFAQFSSPDLQFILNFQHGEAFLGLVLVVWASSFQRSTQHSQNLESRKPKCVVCVDLLKNVNAETTNTSPRKAS